MDRNFIMLIPNAEPEEIIFLNHFTKELSENQFKNFLIVYSGKRREAQLILILTLLGFVGVAGVQRFLINQILFGLIYFFTGGLCLVGTIIDTINYKKLTNEYNQKMAMEAAHLCKMMA